MSPRLDPPPRLKELFASAVQTHLMAYPEFAFADQARLLLADDLVFLGRCEEARRDLLLVQSNTERRIAMKYLAELDSLNVGAQSACVQR